MNQICNYESLIGRWVLISYENFHSSGTNILIKEGQEGSLEYTENREVHVSIKRESSIIQKLGLSNQYCHIQYSGQYEINLMDQTVTHHIFESNNGERVGKKVVRNFKIKNDLLEVSGAPPTNFALNRM